MIAGRTLAREEIQHPISIWSRKFAADRYAIYRVLIEAEEAGEPARVKGDPELIPPAIEEVRRCKGPGQATRLHYAPEDVTLARRRQP